MREIILGITITSFHLKMIHKLAQVDTDQIGSNTTVWQYAIILKGAIIGSNCNINCHCFIENDVLIGDNVTIKSGVYLWDGIIIHNNVFIGPNVTFTNHERPRSKQYPKTFQKTTIKEYSTIGAGSVILGGIEIGAYSMVGAGAVVTKNVPNRALVTGCPARITGWLNNDGSKMQKTPDGDLIDNLGNHWVIVANRLIPKK